MKMYSSFTNVYYFTTIVTTAIGYGSQYTDTQAGKLFLGSTLLMLVLTYYSVAFALVAIPYTQFLLSRITLALQIIASKLSNYMYEKPISQLGIRQTFILVAIFGYFTIMIVLVIPVVFIFTSTEGWTAVEGSFSHKLATSN